MKRIFAIIIFSLVLVSMGSAQGDISPAGILQKIDENMVFSTAYSEIQMDIHVKNRLITKKMVAYSQGNEKSFIEFLSPARDKGTKMLKMEDIIKIYYPTAERVMRLSGHMLRQSMMGSDFSYEDMTERSTKMLEEYTAVLAGEEDIDGRPCYVLEMTSKLEKQTYYKRKTWVDKERFVVLKEELYARSGKLLKVLTAGDIEYFADQKRYYPKTVTMEDKLRDGSKTEMVITKIDFNVDIDESVFSERQLLRK